MPAPLPGGVEPSRDALADQSTLVLRHEAEKTEQLPSLGGRRVDHGLGEGLERDALLLKPFDDPQEMRKRSPQPIELPHNERVTTTQCLQTRLELRPILALAGTAVLVNPLRLDPCLSQRVVLQIEKLPLSIGRLLQIELAIGAANGRGRNPHIANE